VLRNIACDPRIALFLADMSENRVGGEEYDRA
jgi:hypothetical protein